MKAGDIRKGHVIAYNHSKLEVVEVQNITPGRRAAIVQLSLFDIIKNTKYDIRCSPDDDLEQISIYNTSHVYSYDGDKAFVFMNTNTFEEVIVPYSKLDANKSKFLVPEQEVLLGLDEDGNFVTMIWPQKVVAKVKSAPPNQKSASSDDKKRVMLENGVEIVVPGYIKEGEEIIINLTNLEFTSRK